MALSDVFLAPLGLAALLTVIPLVVLYLIKPDPERVELPTLRFLAEQVGQSASNPLLERIQRSVLLLIQLLALVLLALSLAAPYVLVSEQTTVEETVLVVDASASMATRDAGTTRFDRAVAAAGDSVTGTTSVVVAGAESRVTLRAGGPSEAQTALDELAVTATSSDLRAAITTAASIAGENAQVVVLSDFGDQSAWPDAVQAARGSGLRVELRQFDGGGDDNVGIIDQSFSGREVTLAVKNFGDSGVTRTLEVGNQRQRLQLEPGDVASVTFSVPPGGAPVRLTPGDSFPLDDTVYLASPDDATIDVLLLTNDRNRYLATALDVIEEVELTVDEPPTAVGSGYDVIVYSNVEPQRLLRGNVETGRDVVESGGGVAIQAQETLPDRYGDLLLVEPTGLGQNPSLAPARADELTRGITFSPPEEYVSGRLREGQTLVGTADGSPLVATAERGSGRILYYGYIEDRSSFKFNFQYPVFWKRSVFYLAGRETLPQLNRPTGDRLQFDAETDVETPSGTVTDTTVLLDEVGYYTVDDREIGVSLLSESESAVRVTPLSERPDAGGVPAREEERLVPRPVTAFVAAAALLVTVVELLYLRRRGDL